ncbi:MAG: choice-of-anchor L domain-containing protein [Bacteroidales bacterium]|nr:choice-of-anchor L domain-containing protein [Bacteroidales bacterium]MCF8455222.1 choice-of-anchor L domain-containing protein [Bacteroidales bacterium]
MKYRFIFSIFCLFLFFQSWSQPITVNTSLAGDTMLIKELLDNSGTEVFNIQFTGDPISYGVFTKGNSNFSLHSGILLTSGKAINAIGPNYASGISYNNAGPSSPELNAMIPQNTNDASILEFDIISCDTVYALSYVFGSDEYPEWVNASFNDVFGILVSGPNPSGGNYVNTNFALVPGTNISVTAHTVNAQSNSIYYVSNGTGSTPSNNTLQYDGYTVVMDVHIPIIPGEVYHVFVGVADAGDHIIDSGIFFCANSEAFTENLFSVTLESAYGFVNQLFEGYPASLRFTKLDSADLNFSMVVPLVVGSNTLSATSGMDYIALPDSIIITAGCMTMDFPLTIIDDGLPENDEWIYLTCQDTCPYGGQEIEARIFDNYVFEAGIDQDSIIICDGSPGTITTFANAADSLVSYLWSNGSTSSSLSFTMTGQMTGMYYVTISHVNGFSQIDSISINMHPSLIFSSHANPATDCHNLNNGSAIVFNVSASSPVAFLWSSGQTTRILNNLSTGEYYVTVSDSWCEYVDTLQVEYQFSVGHFLQITDAYCNDSTGMVSVGFFYPWSSIPMSMFLTNLADSTNYIYYPGNNDPIDSLPAGDYLLTSHDTLGCINYDSVHIDFFPNMLAVDIDTAYCPGYPVSGEANSQSQIYPNIYPYYLLEYPSFNYEPFAGGTSVISYLSDDVYYGPFPIGFDFEYFGDTVSQFYVSCNGWVSFFPIVSPSNDIFLPHSVPYTSPWNPRNAIFALYRDWNPGIHGHIKYKVTGTVPNQKLVVNFYQVSLYSSICDSIYGSFQVVLHESSNFVDVNIVNGPTCPSWNSGRGVIGIQNASGTIAYTVPGCNNTNFEIYDFSVRFRPLTPTWYNPTGVVIGRGSTIDFGSILPGFYACEQTTYCGLESIEFEIPYVYNFSLDLGSDTIICPGHTLQLDLPQDFVGEWSTGLTDSSLCVTQQGEYSVHLSLADGNCNWYDSVFVGYYEFNYQNTYDTIVCPGDTVFYLFDTAFSYQWENLTFNNWLSLSSSTTYAVTVSNGICDVPDTIDFIIDNFQSPYLILPTDTTKCPDQNLALDGGNYPFYDYYWSNGYNNDYTIIDSVGLYTLTLIDTFGCITVDSVWVTNQLPVSSAFQFFEAFNHVNFINQSQDAYYYFWDFGDGSPISTEANPEHDYPVLNQNMWYTATLVSANQCGSDTSMMQIFTFDIEEMDGESPLQIYPNPNKGNFFLSGSLDSKDNLQLSVFNSTGQEIYWKKISSTEGKLSQEIKLGKVAPGIYFLIVQQKENKWVWKMVVE